LSTLKPLLSILKSVALTLKPLLLKINDKLVRIIKNKINDKRKNSKDIGESGNSNIKHNDIKLLIKLVTDKTINKNIYDKLIRKYNKKRVEKYNIYNSKIHDYNIKKDLSLLETLIRKKIDVDNPRMFIVILLYYINNSPYFANKDK
jgi:hypothetical protein